MQEPLVSVIIPTYNRGNTLRNAVSSVLAQTQANLELIVVDDCSAKPVAETLSDIIDPRFKIVRHETNQGQAAARNTGTGHARGDLLAFLDDDDLWMRDKLAKQLAYMKKEKIPVSLTDFSLGGDQIFYNRHNSKENPAWLCISGCALALPSSMVIEKSVFDEVGGFDTNPAMRRIEDWDFAIQLQRHHYALGIVPEFLTVYAGMHRTNPEAELVTLRNIGKKHADAFPPKSKEVKALEAGLGWKTAHAELLAKHYVLGATILAKTALKHPWNFARYVKVVLKEPLRNALTRNGSRLRPGPPPDAHPVMHRGPS